MLSDALRLSVGWALPWLVGIFLVLASQRGGASLRQAGDVAWVVGGGWFVGAFALTLWMRALSIVNVQFSLVSIGGAVAIVAVALAALTVKRTSRGERSQAAQAAWNELRGAALSGWARALWFATLGWLALRSLILLFDVATLPLYPWDAWIQWATKARVWYELRHIVPFERSDAWFAAGGAAWFDAAPNYPATVPLWQVWTNLTLGRWDDSLMNVPWWLLAVAFMFIVYGTLRRGGYNPLGALVGTWMVSSLPLANVHVALAGYADLPMAAYYAAAAIALWRWASERTAASAVVACVLAIACVTIKTPGIAWALTLVPAVVLVALPRRGVAIIAAAFAFALAVLLVLAQTEATVLGYRLHLDFAPPWLGMFESMFLLGNWHLLWYAALAIAVVGWREITTRTIVPLSTTVATGLLFLFIVFAFTNARAWVTDQTTVNRATLHLAPLLSIWLLIVFQAWLKHLRGVAAGPVATSTA
jgi:hypothetical protein